MAARERIIEALAVQAGPICDDCLTPVADLKVRQEAYRLCTEMKAAGIIERARGICMICGKAKIVSQSLGLSLPVQTVSEAPLPSASQRLWYWEGNVQSRLVAWLRDHGFVVKQEANTATREAGTDIIAESASGQELWISVKGYPERSTHVQARHWFANALFDLVLYRNERTNVILAIALPDGFTTYATLARRTTWLRETMPFNIYWIAESGNVRVE
jgi:hypothetical protein